MMVLIIGGSGSGKSAYAEEVTVSLYRQNISSKEKPPATKKYYLATMQVYDEEGQRRVNRHKVLRSGKGFLTIEQPMSIEKALAKMEPGNHVALLECISNLTANEMFNQEKMASELQIIENVINGIAILKEKTAHLVVVSNNVFEDGAVYDKAAMEYIHAMGIINQRLAVLAEQVVEVTAGIPIHIK